MDTTTFWQSRQSLQAIHQHAKARRVGPWALLGSVLARIVANTDPAVQLPGIVGGPGSPNLFINLVAPSGGGKGASGGAADSFLRIAPSALRTAHVPVGSGEGISAAFVKREKNEAGELEVVTHTDAVLFEVAEVDTLGALSGRVGATLMPEIRKVWSGESLGFANRDQARSLPVKAHSYRAAMIVGVQPTRSGAILDDAAGGTPQRFVWLPATDPHAPAKAPAAPDPLVWEHPDQHELPSVDGKRIMRVCDIAWDTIDTASVARLRGEGDALDGHALYSRLKLAAALALLEERGEVTDEDWELSATIMQVSDQTRADCKKAIREASRAVNEARAEARAEASIVTADHTEVVALERCQERILGKLSREWTSASPIRKNLSKNLRQYFDDAISGLIERGVIEGQFGEYNGQERVQYRLSTEAEVAIQPPLAATPELPHEQANLRGDSSAVAQTPPLPTSNHPSIEKGAA